MGQLHTMTPIKIVPCENIVTKKVLCVFQRDPVTEEVTSQECHPYGGGPL